MTEATQQTPACPKCERDQCGEDAVGYYAYGSDWSIKHALCNDHARQAMKAYAPCVFEYSVNEVQLELRVRDLESQLAAALERADACRKALSATVVFREFSESWSDNGNPDVLEFIRLRDIALAL